MKSANFKICTTNKLILDIIYFLEEAIGALI